MKHSSKRLPPWQFVFSSDHMSELRELQKLARSVWIVLVCGIDGIVAVSQAEFGTISGDPQGKTPYLRIDRHRRTMYRVYGNEGKLGRAKPKGVGALVREIT